jgi:hypothetical protein
MRPFSQKQPFAARDMLIQGNSVRQIWGFDEPVDGEERKPLRRRGPAPSAAPAPPSEDALNIRLGEELDYVRRMLEVLGDQLSGDPILIRRHAVALQSLDIVEQILGHVGNVVRSGDPHAAVEGIGMADLRARLMRRPAL